MTGYSFNTNTKKISEEEKSSKPSLDDIKLKLGTKDLRETESHNEAIEIEKLNLPSTVSENYYNDWCKAIIKVLQTINKQNKEYKYKPSAEQFRSLITLADRVLVDACPGSGKTVTMVLKVFLDAALRRDVVQRQKAITYTKKAAENMKDKYLDLCKMFGTNPRADFSTIHSLAYNLLKSSNSSFITLTDSPVEIPAAPTTRFYGDDDIYDYDDEEDYITITKTSLYNDALEKLILDKKYSNQNEEFNLGIETLKGILLGNASNILSCFDSLTEYGFLGYKKLVDYAEKQNLELDLLLEEHLLLVEEALASKGVNLPNINLISILELYDKYEEAKQPYNLKTFSDMLRDVNFLLEDIKSLEEVKSKTTAITLKTDILYIDEFQDISPIQVDLVNHLLRLNPDCKLYCVGDTDQAIYSFRGSNPEFLFKFKEYFSNKDKTLSEIYYTINRRSTDSIILGSNFIIKNNKNRNPKKMKTKNDKIDGVYFVKNEKESVYRKQIVDKLEAVCESNIASYKRGDKINSTAVLFRNRAVGTEIAIECIAKRLPIVMSKYFLPEFNPTVNKIITVMGMVLEPTNPTRVYKGLKTLGVFLGKDMEKTVRQKIGEEKLYPKDLIPPTLPNREDLVSKLRTIYISYVKDKDYTKAFHTVIGLALKLKDDLKILDNPYFKLFNSFDIIKGTYDELNDQIKKYRKTYENSDDNLRYGVYLETIHSSKGLEYDNVIIIGIKDGIFPNLSRYSDVKNQKLLTNYIEEERRLLFVAMTRAKKTLNIYLGEAESSFFREELTNSYLHILEQIKKEKLEVEKGLEIDWIEEEEKRLADKDKFIEESKELNW